MNKVMTGLGIVLIVVAIASFAYQGFTYSTQEEVVKLGDLKITAQTQDRVNIPPLAGGAALIAGLALLYFGNRRK